MFTRMFSREERSTRRRAPAPKGAAALGPSAHVDTFARDNLPPAEQWPDLRLDRADPFLLQPFLAATQGTGGRIALLHCHPYLREAGMLAHLYPHVYLDAGLALAHVGANADTLVRESLDLAPFSKVLFSTDAWGVPERVLLGAAVWREAAERVLGSYVASHAWPVDEAIRVAELMAWRNADALYGRAFLER